MLLSSDVIAPPSSATTPDVARIENEDGSSSTAMVPGVVGITWPRSVRTRIAFFGSTRRFTFCISIQRSESLPLTAGLDTGASAGLGEAAADVQASAQALTAVTIPRATNQRVRMPRRKAGDVPADPT